MWVGVGKGGRVWGLLGWVGVGRGGRVWVGVKGCGGVGVGRWGMGAVRLGWVGGYGGVGRCRLGREGRG